VPRPRLSDGTWRLPIADGINQRHAAAACGGRAARFQRGEVEGHVIVGVAADHAALFKTGVAELLPVEPDLLDVFRREANRRRAALFYELTEPAAVRIECLGDGCPNMIRCRRLSTVGNE